MGLFNDIKDDFSRHNSLCNLAFWALANYRFGRWASIQSKPIAFVCGKLYGMGQVLNEITSGILIHREMEVGDEFHLIHAGNIKIHPRCRIGDRVGIMHDVTIGSVHGIKGVPIIGNDVFIGAGAKVLGHVRIGDGAQVAANSLVVTNVAPGTVVIGVPARVMSMSERRLVVIGG